MKLEIHRAISGSTPRLDFGNFDHRRVDTVLRRIKATIAAPLAFLLAKFALRTSMAVDTVDIVAARAEAAWRHASHRLQNQFLMFAELVVMIVMAIGVGAFTKQIMHVAQFQFFDAGQIFLGNIFKV